MSSYGVITDALQKFGDPMAAPNWLPWKVGGDQTEIYLQLSPESDEIDLMIGHMNSTALAEEVVNIHNFILSRVQLKNEERDENTGEELLSQLRLWRVGSDSCKIYLQNGNKPQANDPQNGNKPQANDPQIGKMDTAQLAEDAVRGHNLIVEGACRQARQDFKEWRPEKITFRVQAGSNSTLIPN